MANAIFLKEQTIITLTSTGASLTNLSAAVANATADFDCRTAGNAANIAIATFTLQCQWGTITGIVNLTDVADLYMVPLIDGTNLPDVDLTAGASKLPINSIKTSFFCAKAPTASTNMLFQSYDLVEFAPLLYRPYILNMSGQTMSVNWTLKAVAAQASYT